MSLSTYMERLRYVDDLIRRRATGDPNSLARKLKLSRVHTLRLIKEMKEFGFPIEYSKDSKTYYYSCEGRLFSKLFYNELSSEEMRIIKGGASMSIFPGYHYMRLKA